MRPISILPAWLIALEKLAKPLIDNILDQKISKIQFGFKSGSDCGIAKTMILYKCKKYNYNKSLLIDIKKAYDSVNRGLLKDIILKTIGDSGKILIDFTSIYNRLTTVINGKEINNIYGLPQGSAISPILFNLYINEALEKINQIDNLSAQAYADDLILQSTSLETLKLGYNTVKVIYDELNLKINSKKCELISENSEDKINDDENNITIQSQNSAKYLGQIINHNGIPTTSINKVNFGKFLNIISKIGNLTRIAKIRLFHTYMKSKINHLIPLIAITGGIKELWKTIRNIIFTNLLEYSTMPRETASSFRLGYYDIIIRPVLKLIKRNKEYTNNQEEDEMLKDAAKKLFSHWLLAEPNQTDIVKEKIEKNLTVVDENHEEFDKLIDLESFSRLYKNHNPNPEEIKRLRCIKSPCLLVLISNEPTHEIRQRLINYYRKDEDNSVEFNKMLNIILKIYTIQNYINISNNETLDEEINSNENEDIQFEKMLISEIKIRNKWKKIKNQVKDSAEKALNEFIQLNKNKDEKEIQANEIDQLIVQTRYLISGQPKELIKELEIGIELENMYQISEEFVSKNKKQNGKKRPPGRPKKEAKKDNKQKDITEFLFDN